MSLIAILITTISVAGLGGLWNYYRGPVSGWKAFSGQVPAAGGSGILTGMFNLLFGDVGGILNKAFYWGILVILIYLVIKLLLPWGKRKWNSRKVSG